MNIIILGLGKVGTRVLEICSANQIPVKATVSPNNSVAQFKSLAELSIGKNDIVIDFSLPDVVLENVRFLSDRGANIVMGTTGWEKDFEAVKGVVEKSEIGFAYTPNFMPEVHAFWDSIEFLCSGLHEGEFCADVFERRLRSKRSASGTAKYTAAILEAKNIRFDKDKHFHSSLSGDKAMDITVNFSSKACTFNVRFEVASGVKNTDVYAEMAIKTAKWLAGKKGFFELRSKEIREIQKISLS